MNWLLQQKTYSNRLHFNKIAYFLSTQNDPNATGGYKVTLNLP